MPISISTMGKFNGIPSKKASAKYGGSADGPPIYREKKIPDVVLGRVKEDDDEINIYIGKISTEEK